MKTELEVKEKIKEIEKLQLKHKLSPESEIYKRALVWVLFGDLDGSV